MDTLKDLEKQNKKYGGAGTINQMYDAQEQKRLTELENAYKQSLSGAQAAADRIPGAYQQKANDMAVQYERNKQNFNNQAAGSGINTGTASQAALAQNSQWQRDYGKLRTAQADAQTEADRGIANLNSQYQSSVASAQADNDYRRYAALLDEYNRQYARDMNDAQTLAQFGDFSGYAGIYGQEQADNMQLIWQAQNPGLAYNTGRISAEEYKRLTGSYPPGYSPPANVGGASGVGGKAYGEEIRKKQEELKRIGLYTGPVDGYDNLLYRAAAAEMNALGFKASYDTGVLAQTGNNNANKPDKIRYSDVANDVAQLRAKGATQEEINTVIAEKTNSANYIPSNSVAQDAAELRAGYVGAWTSR